MHIDVVQIVLIIVFASLAYWANSVLNTVPQLNKVVSVLIVVVSIAMLVASLFGGCGHALNISVGK